MNVDLYPEVSVFNKSFLFLKDLGFKVIREDSFNYGSYLEYSGHGLKIYLGFDFKEYFFSFDLYKNEHLTYSDEAYGKDIVAFCDLAKSIEPNYDCSILQPNREKGYTEALKNNVSVLKEYFRNYFDNKLTPNSA